MKIVLGADKEGHYPLQAALCGASASLAHDLFMTPLDTAKQRMQLGYYKNMTDCIRTIILQEGARALYISLPTTVIMNLPYGCIMVATNESMKKIINPSEKYNILTSLISGSVAGALAAACTNPLDVIKTKLQTHNLGPCPSTTPSLAPSFGTDIDVTKTVNSVKTNDNIITTKGSSCSANSNSNNNNSSNNNNNSNNYQRKFYSQQKTIFKKPKLWLDFITHSYHTSNINMNQIASVNKQIILDIIKQDGYQGFLRGIVPRMIVHAPSVAISWTVYESIKHFIVTNDY